MYVYIYIYICIYIYIFSPNLDPRRLCLTIGKPAFCLTSPCRVNCLGEIQHVDHVGGQKIKC